MKIEIQKGDFIKCRDSEDAVDTMSALEKFGVETDFCYFHNGEKGIWLEVTKTEKRKGKKE